MSEFSSVEIALHQFMNMDATPLVGYQELCEQVMGLLDGQKSDSMGNIYVPKNVIFKVLVTSKMMASSILSIKASMAVERPTSEAETVALCRRFVQGPGALSNGDVVYFLPRCCTFRDVPPGVPFVVSDSCPDVEGDQVMSFPAMYAIELAYIDKHGSVQTCLVDRRKLSKETHVVSPMAEAPSTTVVS